MNAVAWTIVIYAAFCGLTAGVLGATVRRPRTAPPVLAMLAILVLGGVATSLSALVQCFEGGRLSQPVALGAMLGAWTVAGLALAWSVRRLRPLAAEARRR